MLATGVQTAGRLGIAKGLFVMVISVVCFEAFFIALDRSF